MQQKQQQQQDQASFEPFKPLLLSPHDREKLLAVQWGRVDGQYEARAGREGGREGGVMDAEFERENDRYYDKVFANLLSPVMMADGGLAVIKEVLGLMGFGADDDLVRFMESVVKGGRDGSRSFMDREEFVLLLKEDLPLFMQQFFNHSLAMHNGFLFYPLSMSNVVVAKANCVELEEAMKIAAREGQCAEGACLRDLGTPVWFSALLHAAEMTGVCKDLAIHALTQDREGQLPFPKMKTTNVATEVTGQNTWVAYKVSHKLDQHRFTSLCGADVQGTARNGI